MFQGTAGGLVSFKKQILAGDPDAVFVINADVCGDLPIEDMGAKLDSLSGSSMLMLTTEATRQQSINFGSVRNIFEGGSADFA